MTKAKTKAMGRAAEDGERDGDPVQETPKVHVDHRRPPAHIEGVHRAELADAGVGDEHVESAVLVDGPSY